VYAYTVPPRRSEYGAGETGRVDGAVGRVTLDES